MGHHVGLHGVAFAHMMPGERNTALARPCGGAPLCIHHAQLTAVRAFDTGPGNALLNDWCERWTDLPYDRDGQLGHRGNVHQTVLGQLLGSMQNRYGDIRIAPLLIAVAFNRDDSVAMLMG